MSEEIEKLRTLQKEREALKNRLTGKVTEKQKKIENQTESQCPECGSKLKLHREMTYICDFLVTDLEGLEHVVDVKSSQFFQTEIFKMKKKIFEFRYPKKLLEEVYPKVPKGWTGEKII